ncbi:MAG: 2Fe-2S iron-sulfur cluster-binding protein [Ramlibacter sp.]
MTHRIQIENTDHAFECAPNQSVLDAALHAGIELPYSCRKGVCGSCAGSIASGEVQGLQGAAITNEACLPGQVLYCECAPVSDIVLRPTSWKRLEPGARKTFTARVYSIDLAAPDVSVLRLRLPAGQRAKFQAGQYLQVLLDDGSARAYSMANPPQESDGVTLHIRHVSGGAFTQRLSTLAQGDSLKIELPFGNVQLAADDTRPIVFVAGGTGFAPVKSILDDMLRRKVQRAITLIWGAREPSGLYLPAAVERWRKQWPQMQYIPALSDSPADGVPGAFAGRVDQALQVHCPLLAGHVVHCCGSPAMVAAVRATAMEAGVHPADFHADAFVPGPTSAAP